MNLLRLAVPRQDQVAAGVHRLAHRRARIDAARPVRRAKRRVRTLSIGSTSADNAFFASAISAADIWAKSVRRRTSRPDVVKRASISISGSSRSGRCASRSASRASLTRDSPAAACFLLADIGRHRRQHRDHLADRDRASARTAGTPRRRRAWSSWRLTKIEGSAA